MNLSARSVCGVDANLPTIEAAGVSLITTRNEMTVIVLCGKNKKPIAVIELPIDDIPDFVQKLVRRLGHHWLGQPADVVYLL